MQLGGMQKSCKRLETVVYPNKTLLKREDGQIMNLACHCEAYQDLGLCGVYTKKQWSRSRTHGGEAAACETCNCSQIGKDLLGRFGLTAYSR